MFGFGRVERVLETSTDENGQSRADYTERSSDDVRRERISEENRRIYNSTYNPETGRFE